jgi:hypothetical protein
MDRPCNQHALLGGDNVETSIPQAALEWILDLWAADNTQFLGDLIVDDAFRGRVARLLYTWKDLFQNSLRSITMTDLIVHYILIQGFAPVQTGEEKLNIATWKYTFSERRTPSSPAQSFLRGEKKK